MIKMVIFTWANINDSTTKDRFALDIDTEFEIISCCALFD